MSSTRAVHRNGILACGIISSCPLDVISENGSAFANGDSMQSDMQNQPEYFSVMLIHCMCLIRSRVLTIKCIEVWLLWRWQGRRSKLVLWMFCRTTRWMRQLRRIKIEKCVTCLLSSLGWSILIDLILNILCRIFSARSVRRSVVSCVHAFKKVQGGRMQWRSGWQSIWRRLRINRAITRDNVQFYKLGSVMLTNDIAIWCRGGLSADSLCIWEQMKLCRHFQW